MDAAAATAVTAPPRRIWSIALIAAAPFPIAAALYAYGPEPLSARALTLLLSWSAVVLGFLGGVRWGLEVAHRRPSPVRLAGAVLSPAFGWGLLFARDAMPVAWAIGAFAAAFILQWLFDHAEPEAAPQHPRLLTLLTGIACVSLAVALEQALRL
jgi:hypothetical protein